MCGRYTLHTDPDTLAEHFEVTAPLGLPPRYNVAPAQLVAVIGLKPDGLTRGLLRVKWGFVTNWANDPDSGPKPINARAETVATRPPFEHAFNEGRRLLVLADGFYEWAAEGGKKVPHHFRLKGGGPFAFAGLWDVWKGDGRPPLATCTIITTAANELVRPFHTRMPVILPPDRYTAWLAHDTPRADVLGMLRPLPPELIEVVKLAPVANNVKNDGPECLTPAA
jgi:putative SOS response-associated peptidase YedK